MSVLIGGLLVCGIAGCLEPDDLERLVPLATLGTPGECGRINFTITSPTSVTAVYPPRPNCGGNELVLVTFGTVSWDGGPRTLTVPVSVLNLSASPVTLPIRVELPSAGRTVLQPPGTGNNKIVPLNHDSLLTGERWLWLVGGTGTLAPGDSTVPRSLTFNIQSPAWKGRLWFVGAGEEIPLVSVVPPDTVPTWFRDDSSYTAPGSGVLKNILVIRFVPGTTAEQRQAAIDAVAGQVVGGADMSPDEGYYGIKIPGSGDAALDSAITVLKQIPEVASVDKHTERATLNGRRPEDGNNWARSDWGFGAANVSSHTWAFEDMRFPLAWGCEVGDSAVRVGVVDRSYDTTDLVSNVLHGFVPLKPLTSDTSPNHGYRAAGLIGARGDNGTGITGVMWRGSLVLLQPPVDLGLPWQRIARAIGQAADSGASVVNLNWGLNPINPAVTDDSAARVVASVLHVELSRLQGLGKLPLVVVAAGNHGLDARLSGPPLLGDEFPNNVLVVGAATAPASPLDPFRQKWNASAAGTSVRVFAPAANIWAPRPNGTDTLVSGTSYAAPFVAGLAGLLKSFDSSLTPAELRQLILDGSSQNGQGVGILGGSQAFLVDAYATLKLAAQRAGGGLCGNVVFPQGSEIKVLRGTTTETLIDAQATVLSVTVPHGGRTVSAVTTSGFFYAVRGPTGWTGGLAPNPYPPSSGFELSSYALSHDADSVAYLEPQADGSALVFVDAQVGSTGPRQIGVVPAVPRSMTTECVQRVYAKDAQGNPITNPPEYDCVRSDSVANMKSPRVADYLPLEWKIAYSPFGDHVFVSVPTPTTQYASTGWFGAPIEPQCPAGSQCQRFHFTSSIPSSTIYRFAVNGGGGGVFWTLADAARWVAIADDGDQAYYQTFPFTTAWQWTWPQGPDVNYPPGAMLGPCTMTVRQLSGGPPATFPLGGSCYDRQGAVAPVSADR